ncbi:MAG: hypothetical protein JWQ98_1105 [Chlorobi bacterium]|nr:hypothetical protein [Chlorobiota bacterium]
MLDIALQFLRDELSSYITARTGSSAIDVKLTRIVDEAGKYAFSEEVIGVSLINVEEERVVKEHLPTYSYINGQHVPHEPQLRLNLNLMFAANFRQYDQGLKYLSYILTYFQSHSSFTAGQYPGLDERIEKLVIELQSLTYEQLNQIWAFIGGKQLPCVVYKVRMVALQDTEPGPIMPPITGIRTEINNR